MLLRKQIRLHPFVLGEMALGLQGPARRFIALFAELRQSAIASPAEILEFIEARELHGTGIGYVDTHLLAATILGKSDRLWTRDKRLLKQAERLGVAYAP